MRLTCGKVRTAQTCAIFTVDPVTMKDFFARYVKPKAACKAAFNLWDLQITNCVGLPHNQQT